MKFENILVPIDFSDDASTALDQAIELAAVSGGRLHLLHAYESLSATASAYGGGLPLDFADQIREAAAKHILEWKERATSRGIETETHLSAASPSAAIVETAAELGVDLIVIGTRGLSGLMHVMMGSVAERVVRTAECPVLTVKHPR